MNEKEIEREIAFSHHGGAASAMEDDASLVLAQAESRFGLGQDKLAEALREVARLLAARAKQERATQAEYAPKEAKR